MTGFFRSLFGSKTKYVDEPEEKYGDENSKEDFFLDPDEAQSLGNAEYMRKPKTIRRTFPKTKSNQNTESVVRVSSIEKMDAVGEITSQASIKSNLQPESKPSARNGQANTPSRPSNDGMDMFRNMAREIKKSE